MKKLKQAGRPTKKIRRAFDPERFGTELYVDKLKDVFRNLGAPALWISQAAFIFDVMVFPRRISGALSKDGNTTKFTCFAENDQIHIDQRVVNAARFGHIFAQSPELFCRCINEFQKLVEKLDDNPRFQTALMLAGNKDYSGMKAEEVADRLNVMRIPATPKTVEHARAYLRRLK